MSVIEPTPSQTPGDGSTGDRPIDGGGLSQQEAEALLRQDGPNKLESHTESPWRRLLAYFWGPIPWMIEGAALLSALDREWADLAIVLSLLVINAAIGFWEEHKAGDALAVLRSSLAPSARVRRDGQWREMPARELVTGDLVRLRLGDIVPADVTLLNGDYLSVDQSALTGESLPVARRRDETVYSGSVVEQGEMEAVVAQTGARTYFGRTARLVAGAGAVSHFQRAVMRVGDFLILVAVGLSLLLIGVELYRGARVVDLLQFVLILVVASIPGGHAGGVVGDHGPGGPGPVEDEGHRLPAAGHRGDGRHRCAVL